MSAAYLSIIFYLIVSLLPIFQKKSYTLNIFDIILVFSEFPEVANSLSANSPSRDED